MSLRAILGCDPLEQLAVGVGKRGRAVAVDVDLAEHVVTAHDRDDDLGPGFDAAGEISRIRVHIVDDDRRLLGGCGAAYAAAERDSCVR